MESSHAAAGIIYVPVFRFWACAQLLAVWFGERLPFVSVNVTNVLVSNSGISLR